MCRAGVPPVPHGPAGRPLPDQDVGVGGGFADGPTDPGEGEAVGGAVGEGVTPAVAVMPNR